MINYFAGPEGGGKTALMTHYLRRHHVLNGEVWAFPGYELKNNRGRVVSRLINPAEVMGLIDDMQYVILVIDEIQNFIHHHAWQSPLANVLAFGAAAQRRKREFGIMATGPNFNWLPPDLRMMFHLIFNCRDCHWRDKEKPRGEQIAFSITDMRGVLSGYPGYRTPEKIFWPRDSFKYFDTFSLVDPKYQNLRIKVEKDQVIVDSKGNVITKSETEDNEIDDTIEIARAVSELKAKKVKKLESWELHQMVSKLGYRLNNGIKAALNSYGVHWSHNAQCYLVES